MFIKALLSFTKKNIYIYIYFLFISTEIIYNFVLKFFLEFEFNSFENKTN